jgi:hypothetical protein
VRECAACCIARYIRYVCVCELVSLLFEGVFMFGRAITWNTRREQI